MKLRLLALLVIISCSANSQCTWTVGVTSLTNNSFTLTCTDPALQMQANNSCTNNVSYQWNGQGTSGSTPTVNVFQPGTYSLSVTDMNTSCSVTQTFAISINTIAPLFTLSPGSQTVTCQNASVMMYTVTAITPTTNIGWNWWSASSPPGSAPGFMSNNSVSYYGPAMPGTHTVELTNVLNGCTSASTFSLFMNTGNPTFSVSAAHGFQLGCWPADTLYITNVVLSNTNATASYSFTQYLPLPVGTPGLPLGSTASLVVSAPSVYTVIVQDDYNFCQTAMAAMVNTIAALSINYSYTVTPNGVVNYSSTSVGTNSNTTYLWDYGDGTTGSGLTSSHTYSNGGVHYVTLQTNNPNCVSYSDSVNVNTIPCLANSNYSLTFSGTPQYWYAVPDYFGNVTNAIWNWGDGTSSNALFTSHTYASPNNYNICLTVTVSCANSSSTCANYNIYKMSSAQQMVNVTVLKSLPVGIKENTLSNDDIGLFPNPAKDILIIDGIRQGNIQFYNNFGELVFRTLIQCTDSKSKISTEHLPNGIYVVRISAANGTVVKKLVISH